MLAQLAKLVVLMIFTFAIVPAIMDVVFRESRLEEARKLACRTAFVERDIENFNERYFKDIAFEGTVQSPLESHSHGRYYDLLLKVRSFKGLDTLRREFDFISFDPAKGELKMIVSFPPRLTYEEAEASFHPEVGDVFVKYPGSVQANIFSMRPARPGATTPRAAITMQIDTRNPYFWKGAAEKYPCLPSVRK